MPFSASLAFAASSSSNYKITVSGDAIKNGQGHPIQLVVSGNYLHGRPTNALGQIQIDNKTSNLDKTYIRVSGNGKEILIKAFIGSTHEWVRAALIFDSPVDLSGSVNPSKAFLVMSYGHLILNAKGSAIASTSINGAPSPVPSQKPSRLGDFFVGPVTGDKYQISFTLRDSQGNSVAADGTAKVSILDGAGNTIYTKQISVHSQDFRNSTYGSSNVKHIGYALNLSPSDIAAAPGKGFATIVFVSPDGGILTSTLVNVALPQDKHIIQVGTFSVSQIDGNNYQVVFTLLNKFKGQIQADGNISITIVDGAKNAIYSANLPVKQANFTTVSFGGSQILADSWKIPVSAVRLSTGQWTAKMVFIADNNQRFTSTTPVQLLTGNAAKQFYDQQFLKTAKVINQSAEQFNIRITALRAGPFIHLEHDTSGNPVQIYRIDFNVTNTDYVGHSIPGFDQERILDPATNILYVNVGGTFPSGGLAPGMTAHGYILYASVPQNLKTFEILFNSFIYHQYAHWRIPVSLNQ